MRQPKQRTITPPDTPAIAARKTTAVTEIEGVLRAHDEAEILRSCYAALEPSIDEPATSTVTHGLPPAWEIIRTLECTAETYGVSLEAAPFIHAIEALATELQRRQLPRRDRTRLLEISRALASLKRSAKASRVAKECTEEQSPDAHSHSRRRRALA